MVQDVVQDTVLDLPEIVEVLHDIIKLISKGIKAYELDRKACGLILLMIYVFSSYSAVTCLHRMIACQAGVAEMACGCSIVCLFLAITYIYGTFFGVFNHHVPSDLDIETLHVSDVEEDGRRISTSTERGQRTSESEDISMEELSKLLEEISQKNNDLIEKAASNNQKRIDLLSERTDAHIKSVSEKDEMLKALTASETDKYVKLSTAEIEENLKLSRAFNAQRLLLSTAIDDESFKKEIAQCIHNSNLRIIKDTQKLKLHLIKEEELIKKAMTDRYNHKLSKIAIIGKRMTIDSEKEGRKARKSVFQVRQCSTDPEPN